MGALAPSARPMLTRMKPRLLIVSADADLRRRLRATFHDHPCYEASNLADARRLLRAATPALLLIGPDLALPPVAELAGVPVLRADAAPAALRRQVMEWVAGSGGAPGALH